MKNSSNFVFVESRVKKERDSFVRRKCEFIGFFVEKEGRLFVVWSRIIIIEIAQRFTIFFFPEILINDIGIGCLTRFIVLFVNNFERERLTKVYDKLSVILSDFSFQTIFNIEEIFVSYLVFRNTQIPFLFLYFYIKSLEK